MDLLREAVPDIALSTDIIVAFPGETREEFENTLELARTVRFDDAFTYRYSPRAGTPATRLPEGDFIPDDEAQARLEELIDVTRGIQKEINLGEVGRTEELLVERLGRDEGTVLGRSRRAKAVVVPGDDSDVGSYLTAELVRTTGATFVGTRVEVPVLEPLEV